MPSATKASFETMTSGPLVIRGIHSAELALIFYSDKSQVFNTHHVNFLTLSRQRSPPKTSQAFRLLAWNVDVILGVGPVDTDNFSPLSFFEIAGKLTLTTLCEMKFVKFRQEGRPSTVSTRGCRVSVALQTFGRCHCQIDRLFDHF